MIQAENLSAGYDSGFRIEGIDLSVETGEILGIIGPNGAGKTTLLRALTRVLEPSAGCVLLDGADIAGLSLRALARQVAVVSQTATAGGLDVWSFVLLGRLPHYRRWQFVESREDRITAKWALRVTGAWGLRDRLVAELSGGERQLVLIAGALAQKTRLLLLDEPIAHLDIGHQVAVLDLLRKLNRKIGLTIVMVLHDLNMASEYCHRLALLDGGHMHTVGSPEEVMDSHIIESVYKTSVVISRNPTTSKPYMLPVPEADRRFG